MRHSTQYSSAISTKETRIEPQFSRHLAISCKNQEQTKCASVVVVGAKVCRSERTVPKDGRWVGERNARLQNT